MLGEGAIGSRFEWSSERLGGTRVYVLERGTLTLTLTLTLTRDPNPNPNPNPNPSPSPNS